VSELTDDIPVTEPAEPPGPRPVVAVTMGDPGGIGAEVAVRALADPTVRACGRFIIYGSEELLSYAADRAEVNPYWFRAPHDAVQRIQSGVVVADFDDLVLPGDPVRAPTREGGRASMLFLSEAVRAAKAGLIDAIVTGPISKTGWRMAGIRFPGHTEYLADAYNTSRVTMAFVGGRLRVALASTHVGLFDLRNQFTIGLVFQPIDLLHDWLRRSWHIDEPRIAVCGLNPHAGEEGRFGDEEARIIEPAITMARELGIHVEGPFPADTLFLQAAEGRYDGVVAMYHDQGLIPVKLLSFHSAVNVTLGLPVIRTSVDHGTAFAIAGQNRADPGSLKAAITLACRLATAKLAPSPCRTNTGLVTYVDP
jgi:4-phospho-D-threonate 3-dehydrogenase / 4-phospho-D-erythronate 3-dehydrogenase